MRALHFSALAAWLLACGGGVQQQNVAPAKPAQVAQPAAGESLLDLIPETALAAVVLRSDALATPMRLISGSAAQQAELGAYLRARLGVDLTRARGLVAYLLHSGGEPDWAVFVRMEGAGDVVGAPVGRYHDREVRRLDDDPLLYAATLERGIAFGTPQGLTIAMDLAAGSIAPLHSKAPLSALLETAKPSASFAAALTFAAVNDPELGVQVQRFGLLHATAAVDGERMIVRVVGSDGAKLAHALSLIQAGRHEALAKLRKQADAALQSEDLFEGAAAIIGYHQAKALLDEVWPRLEGNSLVASYGFPEAGGMLPMVGVAAALAVPAFVGYVRRSKTSEARTNLERMFEQLAGQHAKALEAAGANQAKRKQALASIAKLRITRTPEQVPCGEPIAWSEPERARFAAIGFAPEAPSHYSYEVSTPAALNLPAEEYEGVVLVLRATGDLDCDQLHSTFDLRVGIAADGTLHHTRGFYVQQEIE